jgi:predicted secreted protein
MTPLKFRMRETSLFCAMVAMIAGMPAQANAAGPDIVITEQDNGKDVTLHGDQRLIIKLSAQPSTGYGWSALMTPDSFLAFATQPAPAPHPKAQDRIAPPMVGGQSEQVFGFRAAHFTETSSEWFLLIFCGPAQCDLKDAKIFKIGVKTQKN